MKIITVDTIKHCMPPLETAQSETSSMSEEEQSSGIRSGKGRFHQEVACEYREQLKQFCQAVCVMAFKKL